MPSNLRKLKYRKRILKIPASQILWFYKVIEDLEQKLRRRMTKVILLVHHIQHRTVQHLDKPNSKCRELPQRLLKINQYLKGPSLNLRILLEHCLINKRMSHLQTNNLIKSKIPRSHLQEVRNLNLF